MKRAQVQSLETIAVLVVFFILIGAGLVFYYRMQAQSLQEEASEQATLKAISISQLVSFLPELECSRNGIPEENCIDSIKLEKAAPIINSKKDYYYDIFQNSKIVLEQVYPNKQSFNLYDYPLPANKLTSETKVPIPIAIYNPLTDLYGFGVLRITVYS